MFSEAIFRVPSPESCLCVSGCGVLHYGALLVSTGALPSIEATGATSFIPQELLATAIKGRGFRRLPRPEAEG